MQDYYRGVRCGYWGDENGFDANVFFSKVLPLCTTIGESSHHELKILNLWLEEAHGHIITNEWFVEHCLLEYLNKLTILVKRDKSFRESIFYYLSNEKHNVSCKSGETNSIEKRAQISEVSKTSQIQNEILANKNQKIIRTYSLKEKILNHLQKQFTAFSNVEEFSYLLHFLAHLRITPSEKWLNDWWLCTEDKLDQLSALSTYSVLKSHTMLCKRPASKIWLSRWFDVTSEYLAEMSLSQLIKTLNNLQTLQVNVNKEWMKRWINVVTLLLEDFEDNKSHLTEKMRHDIFSNLFKLTNTPSIWGNKRFVHACFNASLVEMIENAKDIVSFKKYFFEVVQFKKKHLNVKIPMSWILPVMGKMTLNFNALSSFDIASVLYSLARFQIDIFYVEPFLQRSKQFFENSHDLFNVDKARSSSEFRQAVVAQNYFRTKGWDLGIDPAKYINVTKRLLEEKKHTSSMQDEVFGLLKKYYKGEMHSEAWVDCIWDRSDLYLPELRLILESDGSYHLVDGIIDQCTELKSYILKHNGFHIVRLDYRHFYSRHKEEYVKNALREFIDFGNSIEPTHVDVKTVASCDFTFNVDDSLTLMFAQEEHKEIVHQDLYLKWLPEVHQLFKTCDEGTFVNVIYQLVSLAHDRTILKQSIRLYKLTPFV
jgi:hypothetical protein